MNLTLNVNLPGSYCGPAPIHQFGGLQQLMGLQMAGMGMGCGMPAMMASPESMIFQLLSRVMGAPMSPGIPNHGSCPCHCYQNGLPSPGWSFPQSQAPIYHRRMPSYPPSPGPNRGWQPYAPPMHYRPPAEAPPAEPAPRPNLRTGKSFAEVAQKNFKDWDADGNGFLEKSELTAQFKNTKIQGDDAAALSALRKSFKKGIDIAGRSNDEFGRENSGISVKDLQALGGSEEGKKMHAHFRDGQSRIEGPRGLFGPQGPRVDGIRQGSVGDCWLIAGLAAKAEADPDSIKKMIQQNQDGSYQVTFPGKEPERVEALTDAERATFAFADGDWLGLMEKAKGQMTNRGRILGGKDLAQESLNGSLLGTGIRSVTGNGSDTDILALTRSSVTRDKLESALKDGRIVLAGGGQLHDRVAKTFTGYRGSVDGIVSKHAYGVLGYDRQTDTVTLFNPHGRGEYKGASDGKDDGRFTMKLSEFESHFSQVAYEERN